MAETKCMTWLNHRLAPKNKVVAKYCKTLPVCGFYGETSNKVDNITDHTEDTHAVNLGTILQSIFVEIEANGNEFNGNEKLFMEYLDMAIMFRKPDDMELEEFKQKMYKDKDVFIRHLKRRKGAVSHLKEHHKGYWGTRQQLRFGKVVGDWIDKEYGSMDPIFGVLLSPTGGLTGPGDSGLFHDMLFDENGPFAFHSAEHDAFGYLLTSHDVGPGYKYLDAPTIFKTNNPLAEQTSGLVFWNKVLKRQKKTGREVKYT